MTAPTSIDPSSLELRAFEPPPFDLAELDRIADALRHGDRAELTLSGPLGAEAAGLLLQEVGHKLKAMDSLRLAPIPGGVAVLRIGSD